MNEDPHDCIPYIIWILIYSARVTYKFDHTINTEKTFITRLQKFYQVNDQGNVYIQIFPTITLTGPFT